MTIVAGNGRFFMEYLEARYQQPSIVFQWQVVLANPSLSFLKRLIEH
jgi:hypothetical protein